MACWPGTMSQFDGQDGIAQVGATASKLAWKKTDLKRGGASKTMEFQAVARYLGSLEENPELRCKDHLGVDFITTPYRMLCYFPVTARRIYEKAAPGVYAYSICRARLGDLAFESFLQKSTAERRASQIVNLSGGFCTRFERYRDELVASECTYIELDLPASQQLKISLAQKAGYTNIGNCHFVEIDYSTDNLQRKLCNECKAFFDSLKQTLVLWEGVAMYLTEAQVDEVLSFIRSSMPKGTLLQFDSVSPELIEKEGDIDGYGNREGYAALKKKGEPFLSGVPSDEKWFEARGFVVEETWDEQRRDRDILRGAYKSIECFTIWRVRLENPAIGLQVCGNA